MFYRIFRRRIVLRRRVFRRRRKARKAPGRRDYLARKEAARIFVEQRLRHFVLEYSKIDPENTHEFKYNRLAIRNTRSRWGSCSSRKNLNFNYRILDLPPMLQDYVIVHELCHLKELHHRKAFWDLMALMIPQARELHQKARKMRLS